MASAIRLHHSHFPNPSKKHVKEERHGENELQKLWQFLKPFFQKEISPALPASAVAIHGFLHANPVSCSKITELSLTKCHLSTLPKEISLFINLQRLDLSDNQLTEIPMHTRALTSLENFNVSHNKLTLSKVLTLPPRISTLDLSHNTFKRIPQALLPLAHLTTLFMRHCGIRECPEKDDVTPTVKVLNLMANKFVKVSPSLLEKQGLEIVLDSLMISRLSLEEKAHLKTVRKISGGTHFQVTV